MVSFRYLVFGALAQTAFAQQAVTLIASSLPACAQSCQTLIQAQTACVPPPNGQAAVSNSATYNSCFCNSAYLTALKGQAAQGVCPTCSAGDLSSLQSWFQGFCTNGGVAGEAGGNANGQTTTSTTSTPSATKAKPAATAKSAGGVTQDTNPADQNRSWISTHARWVIMIVVLFFGLLLFAFILWFLRRRHIRKQELGDHSRAPGVQPDMNKWGPGQSVHDFHAPGEGAAAAAVTQTEKGKERAGAVESAPGSKRNSRRLKKPWV